MPPGEQCCAEALHFLGFSAFCQIPTVFPALCCVQTNAQCCVLPCQHCGELPTGFAFALVQGRAAALTLRAAPGGAVPTPRGRGVRDSCSRRNPSRQRSVSFSKAPWPDARGWGREEISRCAHSLFFQIKRGRWTPATCGSSCGGDFLPAVPSRRALELPLPCASLQFLLITSAGLSRARVLKAFAPSLHLPRSLSWCHRKPVALVSPSFGRC